MLRRGTGYIPLADEMLRMAPLFLQTQGIRAREILCHRGSDKAEQKESSNQSYRLRSIPE